MKKFISKILPTCVIVIVLLVVLLGLLSLDEVEPSYRFLGGRNPIICEKATTGNEDRRYAYSFEADFNDVCSKADAELKPAGFSSNSRVVKNFSGNKFPRRSYRLKNRFLNGPDRINISNGLAYIEKEDTIGPKDGWIVVEIVYWPGLLRLF